MTDEYSEEQLADKVLKLGVAHGIIEELGPIWERTFLLHLSTRALEKDPEYYFWLVDKLKGEKADGNSNEEVSQQGDSAGSPSDPDHGEESD